MDTAAAQAGPVPAERITAPTSRSQAAGGRVHWPLALVMTAYAMSALVVPTMADVAISDDWVYTRSVEILLDDGELRILDISAANALFQIFWGAAFAAVIDNTFGALRLATVVFTGIGALAVYGICRCLRLGPAPSALATATYLFNPLVLSLGFSFMTDSYFTGLLVVATYCYLRGLGRDHTAWVVAGSVVAGIAYAQRSHGILLLVAVVIYLVASGRIGLDRRGGLELVRAAGPALVVVAAVTWWSAHHGTTSIQDEFWEELTTAEWHETWLLVRRFGFIAAMYLGLFAIPLLGAAVWRLPRIVSSLTRAQWVVVAAWVVMLGVGLGFFATDGRRMPYVPHFLGPAGIGPNDLIMSRRDILSEGWRDLLTGLCAVASVVLVVVLLRAFGRRPTGGDDDGADAAGPAPRKRRAGPGLLVSVAALQVVGALAPSFLFRDWLVGDGLSAPSLDRYLVPIIPLVVILVVWALRDVAPVWPAAWALTVALALVSVAGTRDSVEFQRATWELARTANEQGVPNTRLDAGYAWDGYHLWEFSDRFDIPVRTEHAPWWVWRYAPATDSTYVVAGDWLLWPVVAERHVDLWLDPRGITLRLQQRPPPG